MCNACGLVLDPAGSEVALQDPYLVLASSMAYAVPRKALGRQSVFIFLLRFRWKDPAHEKETSVENKQQEKEMWLLILREQQKGDQDLERLYVMESTRCFLVRGFW